MMDAGIRLITTALRQWGTTEVFGSDACPAIVAYLKAAGLPPTDETSWCSAFIFWCAMAENIERPPIASAPAARSWLAVGKKIDSPEMGDIVVLSRPGGNSWQAHVGLFVAKNERGDKIHVLGGNQGNAVNITSFPASRVIGYRRLAGLNLAS